ncbi:hypothetical protein RHMOL_Rhmol12G0132300 [Rhododendron molle]|uniref:Uncharacterized protein n=1 Tax=Rhododendron molle TaxID=49168 RepID=A0ACC0LJ76_RHOML|nr:hypothetical protein RHMOL_Rhmol12G0132300 [Rhododendron molle]
MCPSPICPICDAEPETVEHTLFRCPWTRAVWFGGGKSFWTTDLVITSTSKWLEDLLCGNMAKETTMEDMAAIFYQCWAIWKSRNAFIFSGKPLNPKETIEDASLGVRDYLFALFKGPKTSTPRQVRENRWTPPPSSVVKFNIDGAFKSSRSLAAFGVIARDSGGTAQFWCMGRTIATSAISIEAWALRIACSVAMELDISEAIFESDCLELINCFKDSNSSGPWEIRTIVEDIKEWANSRNWSFVWCYRENNKVAHWLAANCLSRNCIFSSDCIPPTLQFLLDSDVMR